MKDLIYKQMAIDALRTCYDTETVTYTNGNEYISYDQALEEIETLPSAQPEPKEIGYTDCANAMLKMWIDNVLTDGEYSRIMDRLNAHWAERRADE